MLFGRAVIELRRLFCNRDPQSLTTMSNKNTRTSNNLVRAGVSLVCGIRQLDDHVQLLRREVVFVYVL